MAEAIRQRLEEAGLPARLTVHGERLAAGWTLPSFYERRGYVPAWLRDDGVPQTVESLVRAIEGARGHGLPPSDYHLAPIRAGLSRLDQGELDDTTPDGLGALVDLELELTDAFLSFGYHLLQGRLRAESLEPDWSVRPRSVDLLQALEGALAQGRVEDALAQLAPTQQGYRRLRAAHTRLREVAEAGGWPAVAGGPVLETGATGSRVEALRARLVASGDLDRGPSGHGRFDVALAGAVGRFQARHGLPSTGKVDEATRAALNVSAEQRAQQLAANLERWRWLPDSLGERHVLVNIAGFQLLAVDSGDIALRMRAIVGKTYRKTPVFSDAISYVVINPSWSVPRRIAIHDLLPEARRNPRALSERGFRVFRADGGSPRGIDPSEVPWRKLSEQRFPYKLRQLPGPQNALGRVKFMFPNKHDVYLHDTPKRELFEQGERSFSSGCIRIEKPLELAEFLFRGNESWSRESVEAAVARGNERTVRLRKPVPVHLLYWTAWADEDGVVQVRRDIYERDGALVVALESSS